MRLETEFARLLSLLLLQASRLSSRHALIQPRHAPLMLRDDSLHGGRHLALDPRVLPFGETRDERPDRSERPTRVEQSGRDGRHERRHRRAVERGDELTSVGKAVDGILFEKLHDNSLEILRHVRRAVRAAPRDARSPASS